MKWQEKREDAGKKAHSLVEKMTLEEQAGQLTYNAPAIPRLHIPAYNWWNEALHGVARAGAATMFPQAIGMAASFDEELTGRIADCIATEGRAKYNAYSAHGDRDIYKGLTFWSPNVNIFRDPRWGRGHETYGEDPFLTSRLGTAYVKGLQGEGGTMKAAACAKHFAVHSGPEALRHGFDAEASPKDMEETYLPAFEALVKDAKVEAVMGAYNRVNGEPCCGSPSLIGGLLRKKWEFKGHFVSDCWAVRDFHEHHMVTASAMESAALALNSGCDLNCGNTYLHVWNAYLHGLVTKEAITQAAVRLFTTRYLLGLFEGSEYDSIPYEKVECGEHLLLAEKASLESMVLLKNDGILPLCRDRIKTLGVIGPNADNRKALIGNYHGTSSEYITVLEGIRRQAGGQLRILYSEGCQLAQDRTETLAFKRDRLSEARIVAEHSDIVLLCLGLDESLEGEEGDTGNSYASGDKEDLRLPAPQRELMEAVAQTGRPVILCLMTGSAMDLSYAAAHFNAILQLWYPGARGGKSAAEILFGVYSPSGKLPVTFYESLESLPAFTDYSMKGRTYRYMEGKAQYPFGYGLTYGDVRLEEAALVCLRKEPEEAQDQTTQSRTAQDQTTQSRTAQDQTTQGRTAQDQTVQSRTAQDQTVQGPDAAVRATDATLCGSCLCVIKAVFKNYGPRDTADVAQVYIKNTDSPYAVKNPELCAFRRIFVKAGESVSVELPVSPRAFTTVNHRGERLSGEGNYRLYVGTSQPDERSLELTGKKPVELQIRLPVSI